MARHVVVMGVSGSGKTTIGMLLAARLHYVFADADDFHARASIDKMARGEPLSDADREPWLESLAQWIAKQHDAGRSSVLACSALKRRYRDMLRAGAPHHVSFVHLTAARDTLVERLTTRQGHYMPAELLDSQLATLEPLEDDELGVTLDATTEPEAAAAAVLERLETR